MRSKRIRRTMPTERDLALNARAWPFEEARKLLVRYEKAPPKKGYVLFETGYGPSGLPHIGTFGEVVRTTMVRQAFQRMSDLPTRLFAFSDDMDGLRKVPDNVPNKELLHRYVETKVGGVVVRDPTPLTKVPDPFGCHESFGHHNNAMLRGFLDGFGFEYEFQSSTDWYESGRFDDAIRQVIARYDAVLAVMHPTLGEERRRTYSPILPIVQRMDDMLGELRPQVLHHTMLLDELVSQGALPKAKSPAAKTTYHDPCYLGRYNGEFDAPREIIRLAGHALQDMQRCRENSFCCGAGGGRIWQNDDGVKERPSENRIREALTIQGVEIFAVACPKDKVMYSAAVDALGVGHRLKVFDVAELIDPILNVETGSSRKHHALT